MTHGLTSRRELECDRIWTGNMDMASSSMLSRSWTNEQPVGLAGIGLLMQQDFKQEGESGGPHSKVFIKSVVHGGSCHRDGVVQEGDKILQVNGENVVGYSVADIRERIVGPIGSYVRVVFEKATTGETFERTLMRGNPQSFEQPKPSNDLASSQMLSRSMDNRLLRQSLPGRSTILPPSVSANDTESARLKSKIIELESQLVSTTDELQRTKALLENDRFTNVRTAREIDAIQRKNKEQVLELQSLLNKSEQSRRELEVQLTNSKGREEEFHLAFNRAKEETEARENYFAELKRHYDESRAQMEREISTLRDAKVDSERGRAMAEDKAAKVQAELNGMKQKEKERREREETVRQMLHESEMKLLEARKVEEQVRAQSNNLYIAITQWHKDYFVNRANQELELEQYFHS